MFKSPLQRPREYIALALVAVSMFTAPADWSFFLLLGYFFGCMAHGMTERIYKEETK